MTQRQPVVVDSGGSYAELPVGDWLNLGSQPDGALFRVRNTNVTGTTSKTAVASGTVPGGQLGTTGAILLLFNGRFNSISTTHAVTIEVNYGGTVMWATVTTAQTAAGTDHPVFFTVLLSADGATNAQKVGGTADMNTSAAGSVGGIGQLAALIATATGFDGSFNGSATVDSTVNQTLAVNVTLSAATNTTFYCDYCIAIPLGVGVIGATGQKGTDGAGKTNCPLSAVSPITGNANSAASMEGCHTLVNSATDVTITFRLADFSADGASMLLRQVGAGRIVPAAGTGITAIKSAFGSTPKSRANGSPYSVMLESISSGVLWVDGDITS